MAASIRNMSSSKRTVSKVVGIRQRALTGPWFIIWIALSGVAFWMIAISLREIVIVVTLCGLRAYFSDGVRIAHEHPSGVLSNGLKIGAALEQSTYFGSFVITGLLMYGLLMLLRRVLAGK